MKKISLLTIQNLIYNGNGKEKKIIINHLICELWESDKAQAFIKKHNAMNCQVVSLQNDCFNLVALNQNYKVKGA